MAVTVVTVVVFSEIERLPFDVITGGSLATLIRLIDSAVGVNVGETGARDVGDTVVTDMVGVGSWKVATGMAVGTDVWVTVGGTDMGDAVGVAVD